MEIQEARERLSRWAGLTRQWYVNTGGGSGLIEGGIIWGSTVPESISADIFDAIQAVLAENKILHEKLQEAYDKIAPLGRVTEEDKQWANSLLPEKK